MLHSCESEFLEATNQTISELWKTAVFKLWLFIARNLCFLKIWPKRILWILKEILLFKDISTKGPFVGKIVTFYKIQELSTILRPLNMATIDHLIQQLPRILLVMKWRINFFFQKKPWAIQSNIIPNQMPQTEIFLILHSFWEILPFVIQSILHCHWFL